MEYRGIEIVDIPSGMGGTLPAAIAGKEHSDGRTPVICLHEEFYPNWLLTVPTDQIKPATWRLSKFAKRCIDSRLPSLARV